MYTNNKRFLNIYSRLRSLNTIYPINIPTFFAEKILGYGNRVSGSQLNISGINVKT
jgi:hypothetical protein